MFYVTRSAVFVREKLFFVRFAIAVRVRVFVDIVLVRLHRQNAIFAIRQDETRED